MAMCRIVVLSLLWSLEEDFLIFFVITENFFGKKIEHVLLPITDDPEKSCFSKVVMHA